MHFKLKGNSQSRDPYSCEFTAHTNRVFTSSIKCLHTNSIWWISVYCLMIALQLMLMLFHLWISTASQSSVFDAGDSGFTSLYYLRSVELFKSHWCRWGRLYRMVAFTECWKRRLTMRVLDVERVSLFVILESLRGMLRIITDELHPSFYASWS